MPSTEELYEEGFTAPTPPEDQCEWEEWHPDMYPEFAPEGISMRCPSAATLTVHQQFVPGVLDWEAVSQDIRLCGKHAAIVLNDPMTAPQGINVQVVLV